MLGTVRIVALPLAFVLVILLWLVPFLVAGLKDALVYDGWLFDGPLQVFNPLRRIEAGQRGGLDFQSFHGIGLPYVYYPIYALCGKSIHASELSRHWLETLQVLVGYLAVFAGATRRLTPTLGLTAAALVVTTQLPLVHLAEGIGTPIGLRSVIPLLVLGVLLTNLRPAREAVVCGCLSAAGVLIGTEYGLATLIMLGLTWAGRRRLGVPAGSFRWPLLLLLSFAAVLAALLLLIGGPAGATRALAYAFRDIPADQFWYFGAPPNEFLSRWGQLADRRLWVTAVGPLLVGFVTLVEVMRSHPAARPVGVVLLAALVGGSLGLVGYLGYVSLHYMLPAQRMALVVGMLGAWYAWRWAATAAPLGPVVGRVGRAAVAALTVACLVVGPRVPTAYGLAATLRDGRAAVADWRAGRAGLSERLSAHIDGLTRAIDADRATGGTDRPPVIWSTYAGLLESHYAVFHPHRDYIIHAVGPDARDEYLAAFRGADPDYVVTMRRDGRFPYEEQHQNGGWPFYEEVLLNYDVRAVTTETIFWKRRPGAWRVPDAAEGVTLAPDGPHEFRVLPPPGVGPDAPLVVEVEYEVRNRVARVPVIGQTPRYMLALTGCHNVTPVSLPPYRTSWTFAVYPVAGQTPTVYAGTFSLVGGRVTIKRVHVRPLRADGRDRALWNPPALAARP